MIDFFDYKAETLNDDVFYIRDDQKQEPVRLIRERTEATYYNCVKVNNVMRKNIDFIPVDNNIPLKNPDGSDSEKCDALLYEPTRATFIEIKDVRNNKNRKAKKQLESTIKLFNENHAELKCKRQAYICDLNKYLDFYKTFSSDEDYNQKLKRYMNSVSQFEDKEYFMTELASRLYMANEVMV